MTQWYRIGTCSVASGSKTVTFSTGVTLNLSVKPGDALLIGTGTNQPVEIGSITDNTHCELVENWPYASATSAVYAVIPGPNWDDRTALSLDVATYLAAVSGVTQSSTTLTIGMGSQTLQIPHSTRLSPGAFVTISDTAAPSTRYMAGVVTSYVGSTLTVSVTAIAGSGSGSSWNVNVGGTPGATGSTGPANSLAIGTVTTGAAGSSAAATITGSAPSQTLNLTIPRGDAGAGSGDVTAASNFGTDNRLIRSDGTGKGVQVSGVTVDDGDNVSATEFMSSTASPATLRGFKIATGATVDGSVLAQGSSGEMRYSSGRSAGWGGFHTWYCDTTERVRISDSGKVGIGTTSPSYQLHLSTDSAAKPGTNTWTIASDERLKQNIVAANLERCWEIVKTVPLKRYTWKDETYTADQVADRSKLGWIAQDVKPAFKNAVTPFKFTKAIDLPDGVEEYQEQETVAREVVRVETSIEIRNGVPVQVSKTITETVNDPVFDAVAVVDEAGAPVLDAKGNPVTHPVPRMVTKTRPKMRTDTIDDCLSLNADQIYAAMYGALQLAMQRIEALEAQVTALKSA